jgi:hypothetical protein
MPSAPVVVDRSASEAVAAKGAASATLSGYAAVTYGTVKAGVNGAYSASTSADAEDLEEGGSVDFARVSAFADWRDIWNVTSTTAVGRDLIVKGRIKIEGSLGVSITGTPKFTPQEFPLNDGLAFINVYFKSGDLILPDPDDNFGIASATIVLGRTDPLRLDRGIFFDVHTFATEGVPVSTITSLRLHFGGLAVTNAGGDTVSGFFDGNYRSTLTWQGITSVVDRATGEIIDDWTLTSQSGFDYVHGVPEPSSILLAAICGVFFLRSRARIGARHRDFSEID